MTVDILVILKAIKKMLDKATLEPGKLMPVRDPKNCMESFQAGFLTNVENARDMLDELIKQLETPLKKPVGEDLDPAAEAAKEDIL